MTAPFGHETRVASALFMLFLSVIAFAAQPRSAINRLFGALIFLGGAEDLVWELARGAASAAEAGAYARIAVWYGIPALFLTPLLVHHLFPPKKASRLPRWVPLAAIGAATAAFAFAFAYDGPSWVWVRPRTTGGFLMTPGLLAHLFGFTLSMVQVGAVLLAARASASPLSSVTQRRQAGLVGLAFAFPLLHTATYLLLAATSDYALDRIAPDPGYALRIATSLLWLVLILRSAPRLTRAFTGRSRAVIVAAMLAATTAGAYDGVRNILHALGVTTIPGYSTSRFVWVSASAACLALALVRYGLAGFSERMQKRVAALSHVALVLAIVLIPVALALALAKATSVGLSIGLLLGLGAVTLSPRPLRAVSEALSKLLLLDPADPAAVSERARVYAAAIGRADEATLATLQHELGITERDRTLLASVVGTHGPGEAEIFLGRYRVERELGRGMFGVALLATDITTGGRVVVKRFQTGGARTRALAEAQALVKARHPRVVELLAVDRVGDEVFLVLAHAQGGSAQDLLDRDGPLPTEQALSLTLDLLEGLEAVHGRGLVHGDVKPGNLLLDKGGRGLLGDLGSAQPLARSDLDTTLAAVPGFGSYATVAPEILRGASHSVRSDIYAAGAVLHRLLTGEDYIDLRSKTAFQAKGAIAHEPPDLFSPRLSPALAAVIARALSKRPEERYASAAQMRLAVEDARDRPVS